MAQIDLENTIEAAFGSETEPTSDAYTEIIDADIGEDSLTELFDAGIGEDLVEEIYETEVSDDMHVLEPHIVVNIPGGGGGGASTYEELPDKPQIEGNTLVGNKTYDQLGLLGLTNMEIEAIMRT